MNLLSWLFRRSEVKRIYFVRHGETILNAAHVRQGSEGGLSERGRRQAEATGERLLSFPIDIVLVSPFERTKETAAIINSFINKKIEYVDILVERRNPSEVIGKWGGDPEVRKIIDLIDKSFHEGNLRYSDEENFEDLKLRAARLLDYLSNRPEKNILCVTHGIFLTMVMAYMEYGEALTAKDYVTISFLNPANNAGITVCEFNPRKKHKEKRGWRIIAYNDYVRHV